MTVKHDCSCGGAHYCESEVGHLRIKLDAARAAMAVVLEYTSDVHDEWCDYWRDEACNCGLDAITAALAKMDEPSPGDVTDG